ncbi:hypothetical protein OAC63_04415 [Amylibacter sp.]|jgi:hypothetical protein|nr:hypothetical protein [Amylibacter sp.]
MFLRLTLGLSLFMLAPSAAMADIGKENIDSGTSAYRLVQYTRENDAFTCTAMLCERRDSQRCGVEDGLFSISKRTEDEFVYISYYPAAREASRKLETRIRIGSFRSRSFLPIQDWSETWVVPDINKNEDMLYEMEREDRSGEIELTIKTETFDQKVMRVRDLDGMKRDVRRLCPSGR